MKNLLSILSKIRKIFQKKDIIESPKVNTQKNDIQKNKFNYSLQKDIKKSNIKSNIINIIDNQPNLLYNLSIERLEQLNKIYDEKITEKKLKLNKLKRKNTT